MTLSWLLLAATATTFPPTSGSPQDTSYHATDWSARLRADTKNQANWDPITPPRSDRSQTVDEQGHYSAAGTDVNVQVRFFKVENINLAEGSMRIKIWMRMRWTDDRLSWNESAYGGITETLYRVDNSMGSMASEIWVPDLQPYNAITGFVQSLEPAMARVSSDGSVFWSRPGSLDLLCKFSGLVAFPYGPQGECPGSICPAARGVFRGTSHLLLPEV